MHRSTRSKTLTATVTAKHTPEECDDIQKAAEASGLTVSEWARQTHLSALATGPDARLVLSEILALRRVFLALQVDLTQGRELTEDRLKAAMEEADRTKFDMAEKRISAFRDRGQKLKPQPNGEAVQ
jgi:hypothetical protein